MSGLFYCQNNSYTFILLNRVELHENRLQNGDIRHK